MVFGKAPKTTVTLSKRGSGSTQWDPAKAPKTTKVTKYVGAMDPTDEEGDDKEPSSEEEPSSKGKGGFGSASSRTKTTTTKKVVLPTAAKSTSSPEVKTSADRELQELVKKLVEVSFTSNKNAETLRSAFKGAVDSMKGVAGEVSTALESITAQSKESHDATMDGMKVVVNELLGKIAEGAKVNDESEVRSFIRGWDRANTCSGGVVVIALEGATVEGGLEGCKRFKSLAEILGLEGVEASDEEEGVEEGHVEKSSLEYTMAGEE